MFNKICRECKQPYQSDTIGSRKCSNCIVVKNDYYQNNKESRKKYQQDYRSKNKEKLSKYSRSRAIKQGIENRKKREFVNTIKQGYVNNTKNKCELRNGKLIRVL